ncbi:hypothetical protein EKO27_g3210 [Xylaria grammica]|uniref:Uncharacterized protein n=1 Tax=Xylaria grammica TaxID=363999 RepID=A0A439DBX9_9PEZI|nr:hypothetical protein EKO27_g3210 [Xylaria grammica]
MAAQPALQRWFPWAAWPWIFNAPTFSIANGRMAAEVTKAGGIEFPHIAALDGYLGTASELLGHDSSSGKPLPVGVGFTTMVVTLVPEVVEALKSDEDLKTREIPVIAVGGIVNGKGIAAAMALGASGITMGTRLITCPESDAVPYVRRAILRSTDGGSTTTVLVS